MLLESRGAYSTCKEVYACSCEHPKHCRYFGRQVTQRGPDPFACGVCGGTGQAPSSYEEQVYALLDDEPLVKRYAVQVHPLSGVVAVLTPFGVVELKLSKHRFDAYIVDPANLLIEVQGEGHIDKLVTKPKNPDATLKERWARDEALAKAAQDAGFSILQLHADGAGSKAKAPSTWKAQLQQALQHVQAGNAPKLFVA